MKINLRLLEEPEDLKAVEDLQRQVWTGSETDIVPVHLLVATIHNGGLVIGAYDEDEPEDRRLVGFVFGFPGIYTTPDGPRPKHHSHMLGVHPSYRDQGIGFMLKRAQWQMVRHQGLDRITWTFDPLLSRNAHLNITRLGAVCSTYLRSVYGELRDGTNAGLPSDRFLLDWWVNSERVNRRLSRRARPPLDLAHFLAAGAEVLNPTHIEGGMSASGNSASGNSAGGEFPGGGFARPGEYIPGESDPDPEEQVILLVEIPADFPSLKAADAELAIAWRMHVREVFESLFQGGYLVTDFVHLSGKHPRSFYVLSYGESTLPLI